MNLSFPIYATGELEALTAKTVIPVGSTGYSLEVSFPTAPAPMEVRFIANSHVRILDSAGNDVTSRFPDQEGKASDMSDLLVLWITYLRNTKDAGYSSSPEFWPAEVMMVQSLLVMLKRGSEMDKDYAYLRSEFLNSIKVLTDEERTNLVFWIGDESRVWTDPIIARLQEIAAS